MNHINLTSLARMGGCSCKLAADELAEVCSIPELDNVRLPGLTPDDAAILPLENGAALVTTIDFQNVVVDDAVMAGEIAAKNALSDIFACGVKPMYADVVLVLPYGDEAVAVGKSLMRGLALACEQEGCAIVGGHTIRGETPIVGLAVTSVASMAHVKRKSGALPGDALILTKPLGNGIAVAAWQQGVMSEADHREALSVLRRSNRVGLRLGPLPGVTAMTDVTGFGLLGHMSEVAKESGVTLRLHAGKVPILPGVMNAVREGAVPRLAEANLRAYREGVRFAGAACSPEMQLLLCDPQTNGGLLVAVRPEALPEVLSVLRIEGVGAWTVGDIAARHVDGHFVEIVE